MSESSERSSRHGHRLYIKCEQCVLELNVLQNEKGMTLILWKRRALTAPQYILENMSEFWFLIYWCKPWFIMSTSFLPEWCVFLKLQQNDWSKTQWIRLTVMLELRRNVFSQNVPKTSSNHNLFLLFIQVWKWLDCNSCYFYIDVEK